ncbi:MAG TPA: suppressor of fused domain protein, partial [Tepidisphaeraceae bacterium]|nr:suppressor of fused domain protein [Tepidisphaeraceae bacterium]
MNQFFRLEKSVPDIVHPTFFRGKSMADHDDDGPDYIVEQNKIITELSKMLGKPDDDLHHSPVPLFMGGPPDVFVFSSSDNGGVFYVTAGLTSEGTGQEPNDLGQYEIAIATRKSADWVADLASKLGLYSLQAVLSHGETLELGDALPSGSTISAFLLLDYNGEEHFQIDGRECHILLAVGLTKRELDAYRKGDREKL